MPSIFREKFKTLNDVFDLFTERTLFKLITEGAIEGLESPISVGKEANIFTAINKQDERVVVKIYRLSTADFNKMYTYIRSDPRYEGLKSQRRKVVFAWAQREYRNLLKAREAQVSCPTAMAIENNCLVMEYIGDAESPAPNLKDAKPKEPEKFYKQVIENMKRLAKAGMVHTDLSPYNILNNNEKPVLIDFSQATLRNNPNAKEWLERDLRIVNNFFAKLGVKQLVQKI